MCERPLRQVESHARSPREPSRVLTASAVSLQQGSFGAELVASAAFDASRKHPFPGFGPGSGEARCDGVRIRAVTCGRAPCRAGASAKARHIASINASGIRLRCRLGLVPSRQRRRGSRSFGRADRNRKRSRAIRVVWWLCPANTPAAPFGQGSVD